MTTTTFAALGVPDDLVATLADAGITEPFPIQTAVIRDALAGRDVCGRAPTGSGKTLAFGIPLVIGLRKGAPTRPRALVLAPTRELAVQIQRELVPLGRTARRFVGIVYGGVGYRPQIQSMRRGVDILVATPGRLLDLMEQGHVDLSEIDVAVVDEADRMADMGFLPDVRKILDAMPESRRTWLFSATLDGDVGVLTKRYQREPRRHEVEGADDHGTARHLFWRVDHADRPAHTADVISTSSPTVVFCRTRRGADNLTRKLVRLGVRAEAIHGGRSQNQRSRALAGFAAGRVQALVATDVAARGIHVDGVACVIHYDPADDAKAYLHRSGRTARAGADGVVVSLVAEQHTAAVRSLQRAVGLHGDHQRPDLGALASAGERLDPSAQPRPKTRPMKQPRSHSGKKGKKRSNASRHRYWD